jgi:hypothetical protein
VETLLQADAPALLVDLPADGADVRLALRLLDVDGQECQRLEAAPPRPGQRAWRFDLAAFRDTVRHSRSPVLRWELVCYGLPGHAEPVRLPMLSLAQALVVEDVQVQCQVEGTVLSLSLRWRESVPLRHRRVRFWPLWQPWRGFYEHVIPDDVSGELAFEVPLSDLPLGRCRLEFLVVDPWIAGAQPTQPATGQTDTVEVDLVQPVFLSAWLDEIEKQEGKRFGLCLERAFLLHHVEQDQAVHEDQQWCYDHISDATVPELLAFCDLLRERGDQVRLHVLQMKMFSASRITRLLGDYANGQVSHAHFQAYLSHLPRSVLLPVAACEKLLAVANEPVQLHALQQLIRREAPLGVSTVLEWAETATLSDADATALLLLNPNFAVQCLQERTDSPVARRLLEALSRSTKDTVHVGDWVHSNVGWGCIERIEDPHTRAEARWFTGKRSHYQLHVALRPDVLAERITIDLVSASAHFFGPSFVYACTKCESFATQFKDILQRHFQTAHPSRSKKDQGLITYSILPSKNKNSIAIQFLEFASEEPPDQLA